MALSSERPIKVAALAYENVLKGLDGAAHEPSARDPVARYIMERMLEGERDLTRIRDDSLAHLQRRVEYLQSAPSNG